MALRKVVSRTVILASCLGKRNIWQVRMSRLREEAPSRRGRHVMTYSPIKVWQPKRIQGLYTLLLSVRLQSAYETPKQSLMFSETLVQRSDIVRSTVQKCKRTATNPQPTTSHLCHLVCSIIKTLGFRNRPCISSCTYEYSDAEPYDWDRLYGEAMARTWIMSSDSDREASLLIHKDRCQSEHLTSVAGQYLRHDQQQWDC